VAVWPANQQHFDNRSRAKINAAPAALPDYDDDIVADERRRLYVSPEIRDMLSHFTERRRASVGGKK
jgi:hypothetical protein